MNLRDAAKHSLTGLFRPWPLVAAFVFLTLAVYLPSLSGGYFFDDSVYLIDNAAVHVSSLRLGDWWRATTSQCNINLGCRPLSSLTFAVNYYFTGLDPFWLKLTNVLLHTLNGILVFLMLRATFDLMATVRDARSSRTEHVLAAVIAGMWLLLPINVTAVAYVSQRMEELATLFIFIGLLLYARERARVFEGSSRGVRLGLIVVLCTAVGLTAKEDAALLPLYTACVEFCITKFRDRGRRFSYPAISIHIAFLIVPAVLGLIWFFPRLFSGVSNYREFSIAERLMSEPRIIVDYIKWTIFPNLNELTFYHDDIAVSHGLFDPPSTLAAIAALAGLFVLAIAIRSRRPFFSLGVLWFFCGHSMTGTVIPLELAFEHRNYFPSIGLLLAIGSLAITGAAFRSKVLTTTVALGFVTLFCFVTWLRAEEWSHPLKLAYAEALKRPDSSRAQYELARTLLVAAGNDASSRLIEKSVAILERNANTSNGGIASLQALIFVSARAHKPIDPKWWDAIIDKLNERAPSQTDIDAVIFLYRCQAQGVCPIQQQEMLNAFTAALTRSNGNLNLVSAYADFASRELNDRALAEKLSREIVAQAPNVVVYRENLIHLLIAFDELQAANAEIDRLADYNHAGALDTEIADLRRKLALAVESHVPPPSSGN